MSRNLLLRKEFYRIRSMHSRDVRRRALSLYASGLSARAVTRRLEQDLGIKVTPQTIARWMRQLGKSRPVGAQRSVVLGADARRLYESGLPVAQVAKGFHVGKTVTGKRLREMGVTIRPSGSRFVHLLTRERLHAMYVREGRTMKSIADEAGCSIGTVLRL